VLLAGAQATAQVICPVTELTSGLELPLGITQSNQGNLLVSESGPRGTTSTGRITIIDPDGSSRTLLDGLPSGPNDIGDPSGPAGLYLRGRTLYVAIGGGDVVEGVINPATGMPFPGVAVPNPDGPSSPLFSSVLAVHFSAGVEQKTSQGFTLTPADHQALAAGQRVTLSNGREDELTVELVANFLPDYTPNPLTVPPVPANVRASNPFDLVGVGDRLFVTDGGRNLVWQVDINSGAFSVLAEFQPFPNPLSPLGPPFIDAVPTGIDYADGHLLVALFRGFPFPAGTSVVEQVDPETGVHAPLITGLRTAVDVLALGEGGDTDYLVLQHSAPGGPPLPPFANPGRLLRFEEPGEAPTVIANCLTRPTSMALDEKTGTLYVTTYGGRVVAIPVQ
jgi:hypothetical protein